MEIAGVSKLETSDAESHDSLFSCLPRQTGVEGPLGVEVGGAESPIIVTSTTHPSRMEGRKVLPSDGLGGAGTLFSLRFMA